MSSEWRRAGDGPFYVHIDGLPVEWSWRDLKDMIRQQASHGVWTDMAIYPNGQPSRTGFARVKRKAEACHLYRALTSPTNNYNVHIWDLSPSGQGPKFIDCNCPGGRHVRNPDSSLIDRLARDTTGWQSVTPPQAFNMLQAGPSYVVPTANQYAPVSAQQSVQGYQYPVAQQMQALSLPPAATYYAMQPPHVPRYTATVQAMPPPAPHRQPVYTQAGILINTSQGVVQTEQHHVFVDKLSYKARLSEVKDYFGKVGTILRCEFMKNSDGSSKGKAIIEYSSAEEAQEAKDKFNGSTFQGRVLKVRFGKETTRVSPPSTSSSTQQRSNNSSSPLIVNGSNGRA